MATTRATSRSVPPTRTTGASGPPAWPIGRVASGAPPKGTLQRANSARVTAPTSPIRRPRPAGTITAARPKKAPWRRMSTSQPGGVRSQIQAVPGSSHAAATSIVRPKRRLAGWSTSRRSRRAMPGKAAGHQPHGGIEAASNRPASTAVAEIRRREAMDVSRCGCRAVGSPRWVRRLGCRPFRPRVPASRWEGHRCGSWRGSHRVRRRCTASRPG